MLSVRCFVTGVGLWGGAFFIAAPVFADQAALRTLLNSGPLLCAKAKNTKGTEADFCIDCKDPQGNSLASSSEDLLAKTYMKYRLSTATTSTGSPLIDYYKQAVTVSDDSTDSLVELKKDQTQIASLKAYAAGERKSDWPAMLTTVTGNLDTSVQMAKAMLALGTVQYEMLKALPSSAQTQSDLEAFKEYPLYPAQQVLGLAKAEKELTKKSPLDARGLQKLFDLDAKRLQNQDQIMAWDIRFQKKQLVIDSRKLAALQKNAATPPLSDDQLEKEFQQVLAQETMVGRGFTSCGLTTAEQLAIEGYTETDYMHINQEIRTGALNADGAQIALIENVLKKLRPFTGVVHRDLTLTPAILAYYTPGSIVTEKEFLSTSELGGFQDTANAHITIHSLSGRFLAPFSNVWTESEVLFPPRSRFKVLKRTTSADGATTDIEVQEVN